MILSELIKVVMAENYFAEDKFFFANIIRAFETVLDKDDVSTKALLAEAGIDSVAITREEPEITISELLKFVRLVRRDSKDPAVMLKAGSAMTVTSSGILGYAMMCCSTLAEAYHLGEQLYDVIGDIFFETDLEEINGQLIEVYSFNPFINSILSENVESNQDSFKQDFINGIELAISSMITLSSNLIGGTFCYESIHLEYNDPGYADEYTKLFQCPVYFGCEKTKTVLDAKILSTPLPFANPLTLNTCLKICDDFLNQQVNSRSLIAMIRQMLLANELQTPSMELVADRLDLTPRTLRRHLKEQGTNFQTILDEVRRDLALELLKETRLTVDEIAEKLNYADTANFRNAFKRWVGMPPGQYRKKH